MKNIKITFRNILEESVRNLKTRNLVISIGLLFMCCISSCDFIERKRNEKAKQDSLNILRNQEFNDSIKSAEKKKNAKIDSLAQYAWGDAKFEMSLNEVKKTKAFNGNYINAFKNDGCMFFVFARFHDDKLYQVEIETHDKTANYIDAYLLDAANSLKKSISEKYGEPKEYKSNPSVFDFKPGYKTLMYTWEIGDKKIEISMVEKYSGSEYKTTCIIWSERQVELKRKRDEALSEQQQKADESKF